MNMNVRISNDSLTAELIQIWIDVGNTVNLWFDILAWVAIIAGVMLLVKWTFGLYKSYKKLQGKECVEPLAVLVGLWKECFPKKN